MNFGPYSYPQSPFSPRRLTWRRTKAGRDAHTQDVHVIATTQSFTLTHGHGLSQDSKLISRWCYCRNLGFRMRALNASAIRWPLTWLLSERYIRARSLLLYPYVFVAGPNKHDPFIELVTERKFQHEQPTELA